MKWADAMKCLDAEAADALRTLLDEVPSLKVEAVEFESSAGDHRADLIVRIKAWERPRLLVCEVKGNGQPRQVMMALQQLRRHLASFGEEALPVFISPYLSPKAQALCREDGTGYLDLHGNAHIVFDGIYIDRRVPGQPPAEKRALRSLFKPKSAQVLRTMLHDPGHSWRLAELAETAAVSLGHVSNVKSALMSRDWAEADKGGLHLSDPGALLDAWRDQYEPPPGKRIGFYTILHGSAFEDALPFALGSTANGDKAILASFSAARWLAPYGRVSSHYFYANRDGLRRLTENLKLSPASKGENVFITVPKEDGLFLDAVEPASGIVCASPVQTYLDLSASGERGREAADHLRQELLKW